MEELTKALLVEQEKRQETTTPTTLSPLSPADGGSTTIAGSSGGGGGNNNNNVPPPIGTVGGTTVISDMSASGGGNPAVVSGISTFSSGYSSNFVNKVTNTGGAAAASAPGSYSAVNTTDPNHITTTAASGVFMVSGGDDGLDTNIHERKPHICCNVCCDCRRACLIVNGVSILFRIFTIIFLSVYANFISNNAKEIEDEIVDDAIREEFDQLMNDGGMTLLETLVDFLSIISIGLHGCGIYGAIYFKQWGIITAGATYGLTFALAFLSMDLINMIISGCFIYPHYIFYKEMKDGIMTEYNYHKIAFCCGNNRM